MSGAVITGAFVMAAVGAFYLLSQKHVEAGKIFVRVGVIAALLVSVFQVFPTGDAQGRMLARNQPVTLAAMEALWQDPTRSAAGHPRPARHGEPAHRQSDRRIRRC